MKKFGLSLKGLLLVLSIAAIVVPTVIEAYNAFSKPRREQNYDHFSDLLDVVDSLKLTDDVKEYEGFRVGFNRDNAAARWVAWELLGTETSGTESRRSGFWHDDDLEGCAFSDDYRNSGYDRGHLCPAADQKWSEKAMTDCFVMSNIVPQDHALNSGAWQTLEKKERLWALRDSALVIVAGPIYKESDAARIGETGVRVPSAFYKIIAAPYLKSPRGIAFVYPNMTSPGNMEKYVMTIRDVEKLTGLNFLSGLPDMLEDEIETKTSFTEWNRN